MFLSRLNSFFKKMLCHISPVVASKYCYFMAFKEKLNLKQPKKFNEKLMWLKHNVYMNNPIVWKCVDKYLVRKYALSKGVANDNLPELIATYNFVDEINFEKLPNKFALKCSHGCGFNIICENKETLDIENTKKQLNKWLNTKFGYESAELQYIHEKPRIICEKFIESNEGLPYDYKVYCFNGEPKMVLVCSEREKKLRLNFFDLNWRELFIGKSERRNLNKIEKPKNLDTIIILAKKVSKEFPFVRVDFYEHNNKIIMGEMTFTPAACLSTYYNKEGDKYLSDMLNINS